LFFSALIALGLVSLIWLGQDQPQTTQPEPIAPPDPQTSVSAPAPRELNQNNVPPNEPGAKQRTHASQANTTPASTNPSVPIWEANQFKPASDNRPGEWISQTTSLGYVYLNPMFFNSLQTGMVLRLPLDQPLDYQLTESSEVVDAPGTSWLTTMVDNEGALLNHHGVITVTPELVFVTLHSAEGIYYLHSTDKQSAELAYVSKADLQTTQQ